MNKLNTALDEKPVDLPSLLETTKVTKVRAKKSEGPPVTLTASQQKAMDLIAGKKNILVTGPAGTGKSFLLHHIKETFPIVLTASTGIAAVNIEGQTINSWAGIGLGDMPLDSMLKRVKKNSEVVKKMRECQILAIDEISMIHPELFGKLNVLLQAIRNNNSPFGGIQLLLFGDFLQLPPINKENKNEVFCFDSAAWTEADIQTVYLREIVRQTSDIFAASLQDIRIGEYSVLVSEVLRSRYKQPMPQHVEPVVIHSNNDMVEQTNTEKLAKLWTPEVKYIGKSGNAGANRTAPKLKFAQTFDTDENPYKILEDNLVKNCLAPSELILKEGCQVMLLANLDVAAGLVNGSLGHVVAFEIETESAETDAFKTPEIVPVVKFLNGLQMQIPRRMWKVEDYTKIDRNTDRHPVLAWFEQFPLKVAYALTIHKTQGLTLDAAKIYLDKCFAPGQAYVALSRVKSLDGLFIESGNRHSIKTSKKALEFYEREQQRENRVSEENPIQGFFGD